MSNSDRARARPAGRTGRLFVVSAASGSGKTTVVNRLVALVPGVVRSRSYTSRAPRADERDGVDYDFVSRAEFEAMAARGEFLESADVFGDLYGTRARETNELLARGIDVVLVIDVQGARQVRSRAHDPVTVFVLPPSAAVLEQRLRGRRSESEDTIRRRLAVARDEVRASGEYDFIVVNDDVARCVDDLAHVVLAYRTSREAMREVASGIVATFAKPPD